MKKSKFILATVAATVFATSAGALVACGEAEIPEAAGVFEISVNANGGTFTDGATVVKYSTVGGKVVQAVTEPTREGDWYFNGYNLNADGSGTTVTFGASGTKFSEATTVYAQWAQGQGGGGDVGVYEITYDPNGGAIVGASAFATTVNGKLTTLLGTADVEYAGHTFDGWYTLADGGTKITTETMFEGTATIYAHWTAIGGGGDEGDGVYEIMYNPNGGSFVGGVPSTANTVNGKLTTLLGADNVEYAGHTFDGWYTLAEGGDMITTGYTFSDATTIYAHWTLSGDPISDEAVMTVNGEVSSVSWSKKAEVDFVANQDGEYYANEISLSAGDQIAFTVNGTPIRLFLDNSEATLTKPGEASEAAAYVTVKDDGEYTISIKHYIKDIDGVTDNPADVWCIWAGVPGDPDPVGAGVVVGIGGNWEVADGVALSGPTTNEYGDTEYTARIVTTADGETIKILLNDVWYAHLQSNVPSTVATGGGFGNSALDITIVKAGTYDIYLKIYSDGNEDGSHDIWVQKIGGTEEPDPDDETTMSIKIGSDAITMAKDEKGETDTWIYQFSKTQTLQVGDEIQFLLNGETAVAVWAEGRVTGCECGLTHTCKVALDGFKTKPRPTKLTATVEGEYKFYLKYYGEYDAATDMGGYVLWVEGPAAEDTPIVTPGTKVDGIYVGGELIAALTQNMGANTPNLEKQYWLGAGTKATLNKNDVVELYIGNEKVTVYNITGNGIQTGGGANTSVTVTRTGEFEIYLNKWSDTGNYTVEFSTTIPAGVYDGEVPAEAAMVTITFAGGTTVSFYVYDDQKQAFVKETELGNYKIYMWGGGEHFGGYPGTAMQKNMTSTKAFSANVKFLINQNGDADKTGDLGGFTANGTFVVTYKKGNGKVESVA